METDISAGYMVEISFTVQTASSLQRMRDSFIFHAHNNHGMNTSAVVLGIDAARTLASGNDVHKTDLAFVF
jgi:diphthamide synthase (EF-2-diphthine--ammonia ligase)